MLPVILCVGNVAGLAEQFFCWFWLGGQHLNPNGGQWPRSPDVAGWQSLGGWGTGLGCMPLGIHGLAVHTVGPQGLQEQQDNTRASPFKATSSHRQWIHLFLWSNIHDIKWIILATFKGAPSGSIQCHILYDLWYSPVGQCEL